jgi:hypothetical protein
VAESLELHELSATTPGGKVLRAFREEVRSLLDVASRLIGGAEDEESRCDLAQRPGDMK